MALPINIEELLGGQIVEDHRVEYKRGWNPDAIYRTICAFANDFDDICGGYIVVGVDEVNGRPVRPVAGIDANEIEPIEKDMVGFNNLIVPYYQPRVFFEQVDGKTVMVIWVTAGERRPYKVPDNVTAKDREKKSNYYIRYNSSSIVAKGDSRLSGRNEEFFGSRDRAFNDNASVGTDELARGSCRANSYQERGIDAVLIPP